MNTSSMHRPLAVHEDGDVGVFEGDGKLGTGELAVLVGVEDLRLAQTSHSAPSYLSPISRVRENARLDAGRVDVHVWDIHVAVKGVPALHLGRAGVSRHDSVLCYYSLAPGQLPPVRRSAISTESLGICSEIRQSFALRRCDANSTR